MKITKFAHCSLLIDTGQARILFDPGSYSGDLSSATDLDAIIITHQHSDHLEVELLRKTVDNNPNVRIISHDGPAEILTREGFTFELLKSGKITNVGGAKVLAFSAPHAPIYGDYNLVKNMGYIIEDIFCFAGDSLHLPPEGLDLILLALPVVAPWLKISEAIDYAKAVRPQKCLPVHDGFLTSGGPFHRLPKTILEKDNIEFVDLDNGASIEL